MTRLKLMMRIVFGRSDPVTKVLENCTGKPGSSNVLPMKARGRNDETIRNNRK